MRYLTWPAALAAVLALTAGCASSPAPAAATSRTPSPSSTGLPTDSVIQARIAAARQQLVSVHVSGKIPVRGGGHVTMNLTMTKSGDTSGTLRESIGTFRVLVLGRNVYVKLTPSSLRAGGAPATACATVCGKWAAAPGSLQGAIASVDWQSTLAPTLHNAADVPLTVPSAATIDGRAAYTVGMVGGGSFTVAATGPAYLLTVSNRGVQLTFSQWNSAALPQRLPASQLVAP